MSTADSPQPVDDLTDDERALFERIAEKHEDDDEVRRICEIVLQSSDDNEEANS
ncbi:hypothetical protein SAMN04488556_1774 [Halostagnicola kamekurae]|uniref:Uncharacterized protein n=1 Tax=Halostagnicola kamekurae TaxID=619731 RepID=A0A1I6RG87_9EURY|nr:hypothetical protein SAMN04488556_1774 [Halostagnicola kamekurae]